MKSFALVLSAATLFAPLAATPGFAGVGSSLGECYNILIQWCNDNSNHPQACANTVMDACDDMHKAQVDTGQALPLAAAPEAQTKPRKPKPEPTPKPEPKPRPGKVPAAMGALRG